MPTKKQMEKLAKQAASQPPAPDDGWWRSVISDPALDRSTWVPIQQRRLSEIPRPALRVECIRCFRIVEIQHADAVQLYGQHAVWKDIGLYLLDDGCNHRTGSRDNHGCWPDWKS